MPGTLQQFGPAHHLYFPVLDKYPETSCASRGPGAGDEENVDRVFRGSDMPYLQGLG